MIYVAGIAFGLVFVIAVVAVIARISDRSGSLEEAPGDLRYSDRSGWSENYPGCGTDGGHDGGCD